MDNQSSASSDSDLPKELTKTSSYGSTTPIKLHRVSADHKELLPQLVSGGRDLGYLDSNIEDSMTDSLLSSDDQDEAEEQHQRDLRRAVRKIAKRVVANRQKMSYTEFVMDQGKREFELVKIYWKILVFAVLMQYFHSVFTNIVYFAHRQGQRLPDLGYTIFPELNSSAQSAGDYIFGIMMIFAGAFLISPFVYTQKSKPLFATLILARLGAVVSICEILRSVTFLSTILPSPADHCQPGAPDYDPPSSAGDILFGVDAFNGCGDLIFSSHTLICLNVALMFQHYCKSRPVKLFIWLVVIILSLSVIAARHHYTVDVVVAWYVSPMVWIIYSFYYQDVPFPILDEDIVSKKARTMSESELVTPPMGKTSADFLENGDKLV